MHKAYKQHLELCLQSNCCTAKSQGSEPHQNPDKNEKILSILWEVLHGWNRVELIFTIL